MAQRELVVAVDYNQLQTMASEAVDPIDWSHPHPHGQYPPERLVHSINWYSLSSTGNRPCNFSMRGNHLAYAATRGIRLVDSMINLRSIGRQHMFSYSLHFIHQRIYNKQVPRRHVHLSLDKIIIFGIYHVECRHCYIQISLSYELLTPVYN